MGYNRLIPRPAAIGLIYIFLTLLAYIFVYQTAILPGIWSDVFLNAAIFLPAIVAAIYAVLVYLSFDPQDPPRQVWLYFAMGLIFWAIAEVVWFVLWLQTNEVPTPSWADVFWLLGIAPLVIAFLLQFRIVYHTNQATETRWILSILAAMLVASVLGTVLLHQTTEDQAMTWGQTFLEVFYAVDDAAMMIAALTLARLFGRGMWGRAWWGLLAFVISDALYSYVTISGLYAYSVDEGNLLSLVVDTIYSLAYLLMAFSCWSQWLLMRHGPTLEPPAPELTG